MEIGKEIQDETDPPYANMDEWIKKKKEEYEQEVKRKKLIDRVFRTKLTPREKSFLREVRDLAETINNWAEAREFHGDFDYNSSQGFRYILNNASILLMEIVRLERKENETKKD